MLLLLVSHVSQTGSPSQRHSTSFLSLPNGGALLCIEPPSFIAHIHPSTTFYVSSLYTPSSMHILYGFWNGLVFGDRQFFGSLWEHSLWNRQHSHPHTLASVLLFYPNFIPFLCLHLVHFYTPHYHHTTCNLHTRPQMKHTLPYPLHPTPIF